MTGAVFALNCPEAHCDATEQTLCKIAKYTGRLATNMLIMRSTRRIQTLRASRSQRPCKIVSGPLTRSALLARTMVEDDLLKALLLPAGLGTCCAVDPGLTIMTRVLAASFPRRQTAVARATG